MSLFIPDRPQSQSSRSGVLLLNLGTPDAPTAQAIRPYLAQFLSDLRIIELSPWKWKPILHGIVLNTRPKKSAQKYQQIWQDYGSPLAHYTQQQTELLRTALAAHAPNLVVEYAMRYGNPSVDSVIEHMRQQGVERFLVIPLYPQYAASSSGSALDAVLQNFLRRRNMPDLRTVRHFHQHPAYLDALALHIREYWQQHTRGQHLLMSFHSIPKNSVDQGDPYFEQCHHTAQALAHRLELAPDQYTVSFQSRFGRTEWLRPYTIDTFPALVQQNILQLDVVCPGFVSDCLETLEEIAIEGQEVFLHAGGQHFQYIPCLNTRPEWIQALVQLVQQHTQGWPT